MFADNTLTPKEAVRLCALGLIARSPQCYSALAGAVRNFVSHVAGPQLELMGMSIELLRYEGLVEAVEGTGMEDDAVLAITEAGRRELHALLTARLRPGNDLSKLIVALKIRFLDILDPAERRAQSDLLLDLVDGQLASLMELRDQMTGEDAHLTEWLDLEIRQLEQRLSWLEGFSTRL